MKISEFMKPVLHTVRAEANLEQAAAQMRDEGIDFLPVVKEVGLTIMPEDDEVSRRVGFPPVVEQAVPVGAITDDLIRKAIAAGRNAQTTTVAEIMMQHVPVCGAEDQVADAASLMERENAQWAFVLTQEGHMAGVLSRDAIANANPQASG